MIMYLIKISKHVKSWLSRHSEVFMLQCNEKKKNSLLLTDCLMLMNPKMLQVHVCYEQVNIVYLFFAEKSFKASITFSVIPTSTAVKLTAVFILEIIRLSWVPFRVSYHLIIVGPNKPSFMSNVIATNPRILITTNYN